MSCNSNRFVITKGYDNTFEFTIKANGSTLPMEIDVSDSFTAELVLLEDSSVALSKSLTIVDALSGRVQLVITEAESNGLSTEKGTKVDRYYVKPMYKLVIECNTLNNGNFLAKVNEVYVD